MKTFARIKGTGSFLPIKTVDNEYFTKYLETTDEWIQKRTGIQKRHLIENETVTEMAYQATNKAILSSKIDPQSIEMILVATTTPDSLFPSVASSIQSKLQINHCAAMDINAACSGFIYALDIAQKYILNGTSNILVIGVDALSRYLNWQDRKTCILFGDGAGAVIVSKDQQTGIIDSKIQNIIDQTNSLTLNLIDPQKPSKLNPNPFIEMEGQKVFKIAVQQLSQLTKKILHDNQIKSDDLDYFIPHQANIRIMQAVAKNCNIPKEKIIQTISEQGNTSASSIPSALDVAIKEKKIKRNQLLLLVGFGAGMTMGGTLLRY